MLRIPHYLDNRLTVGVGFVRLTHRPHRTIINFFSFLSLILISQRLSKPQDLVRPEGLVKLIELYNLIGFRTRYLPASSIVLSYRVPADFMSIYIYIYI
jgi:hypothetical protein